MTKKEKKDEKSDGGVTVKPGVATSSPQSLLGKLKERIGWDNTLG